MINIDKFLADDQDLKAVEKIISKIQDLLHPDEELLYLAVQKKPAVNLLLDSIVLSNQGLYFCNPTHLGLTLNIKDISFRNIKEVAFKEEFFGAQFICIPQHGDPLITDYIPKVQARKLHQLTTHQLDIDRKSREEKANTLNLNFVEEIDEAVVIEENGIIESPHSNNNFDSKEDEITNKLRKLKFLFNQELITKEEYEQKKAEILANL
ncbi:MAG: hypothetical protein EOO99_04080 [Pedobacter sp.]|nr:MAG: hypothetical protein EOO99_04080 [Pedobacter sp.]